MSMGLTDDGSAFLQNLQDELIVAKQFISANPTRAERMLDKAIEELQGRLGSDWAESGIVDVHGDWATHPAQPSAATKEDDRESN